MRILIIILTFILLIGFFNSCEKTDEEPPVVTILSIQDNDVLSGTIIINCLATDNEEVEKVELWLDGEFTGISDKTEPFQLEWNTTEYVNNEYIVSLRVYDVNNNKTDSNPIRVSIYNNLNVPVASFKINPESGTIYTTFTFDASQCSDVEDTNEQLLIRWDWENDGSWDTDYSSNKIEIHSFDSPGIYTTKLEVKDTGYLVDTDSITIHVRPYTWIGTWLSAGADVAPILVALFTYDSVRVEFKDDNTLILNSHVANGTWTSLNGTYTITSSSEKYIHKIAINYTAFEQEGIIEIVDEVMRLEIVQTVPDIGATVPTVADGFGADPALGTFNIQTFKKVN